MSFDIIVVSILISFSVFLICWMTGVFADRTHGYFDFILKRKEDELRRDLLAISDRQYDERMLTEQSLHYSENQKQGTSEKFDPYKKLSAKKTLWAEQEKIKSQIKDIHTPNLTEFKRLCLGVKIYIWLIAKAIKTIGIPVSITVYIQRIFGIFGTLALLIVMSLYLLMTLFLGRIFAIPAFAIALLFLTWHLFWDFKLIRACTHSGVISAAPGSRNKKSPRLIWFSYSDKSFIVRAYGVSLDQFNERGAKKRLSTLLLYGHKVLETEPTKWPSIFKIICSKQLPERIPFTEDIIKNAPEEVSIYSGYDGKQHRWIPLKEGHVMLVGVTGTGKSTTARSQLTCLLAKYGKKTTIYMVDFKKSLEAGPYKSYVTEIVCEIEDAVEVVNKIHQEMENRLTILRQAQDNIHFSIKDATSYRKAVKDLNAMKSILVIFDEFADMADKLKDFEKKNKGNKHSPTLKKIIEIGRKGRAAACHMMVLSQRPDVSTLVGEIKTNIDIRFSGRMASQTDSVTCLGSGDAYHIPSKVKGRFIAKFGEMTDVQFPDLSLAQSLDLLKKYGKKILPKKEDTKEKRTEVKQSIVTKKEKKRGVHKKTTIQKQKDSAKKVSCKNIKVNNYKKKQKDEDGTKTKFRLNDQEAKKPQDDWGNEW